MPPTVSTAGAAKRRVLASAYACEPGRGSEPGIGWNLARQIALHHELTLVTRENNVDAVRAAAAAESLPMEVIGHDLPKSLRFWKRGSRGAMPYYYLWQKSLTRVAQELCSRTSFEVAHHLTFASGWLPSGLAATGLPFVLGPVGEHPRVPRRFLGKFDLRANGGELFRASARRLMPIVDRDVRATWRAADVILSLGQTFGGRIPEQHESRVLPMLACGIDGAELFEPSARDQSTPMRVIFAGRLVDLKGIRLALQAFALASESIDATFDVYGTGKNAKKLSALAQSLGVADRTTFHGQVKRTDILAAMRRSDVFLFPSFEGGGMVVPEAMASGSAVVCLDCGGPGEMAQHSRGVAVSVEASVKATASELAKALERLARDESCRLRIAEIGHEWARRSATWSAKGLQFGSIYERAIGTATNEPARKAA